MIFLLLCLPSYAQVRKNFANSRMRVKGRFITKDDEAMLKELMALS